MKKNIIRTCLTLAILVGILLLMAASTWAAETAAKADLVFVVDTTGSMGWAMANLKSNVGTFVNELETGGLEIRLGLIEYKDISPVSQGGDGDLNTTIVHTYNGSTWMDVDGFITVLGSLFADGGNDTPETAIDALGYLVQEESPIIWGVDAYRFAFLITDAPNKLYNRWGYDSMEQITEDLVAQKIYTSVVGPAYPEYVHLTGETGGILTPLTLDFANALKELTDSIIEVISTWTVSFYKQSQDGNNGIAKSPYASQEVKNNEQIDWTKISAGKNAVWYITDGKTYGAKFDPKTPITGDLKLAVKDQNNN
jgi:hypothetical protein